MLFGGRAAKEEFSINSNLTNVCEDLCRSVVVAFQWGNQGAMLKKIKYLAIAGVLCFLVVGGLVYFRSGPSARKVYSSKSPVPIQLTAEQKEQIRKMIEADLSVSPTASEPEKMQKAYLNLLLRSNPTAQDLFMQTYKFFGAKPEAFAAARFVAMYTQMNGGLGFKESLAGTYKDLKQHTHAILENLVANQELIAQYPAYQIAALNLAHQLEVNPEAKARFYSANIAQKIEFDDVGGLKDSSQGFELALILAKSDRISSESLKASVQELAKLNARDAKAMSLIRVRVENYYPEMASLFN